MKAFQVSFSEMPGLVMFIGEDMTEATQLFEAWRRPRFRGNAHRVSAREAMPDHIVDFTSLKKAMTYGHKGVAVWIGQPGWVILPVSMNAPGPLFFEKRPVKCFVFEDIDRDVLRYVFAATLEDARTLFRTWRIEATGREPEEYSSRELPLDQLPAEKQRWADVARMGVIGLGSTVCGICDILPPWDENAGYQE